LVQGNVGAVIGQGLAPACIYQDGVIMASDGAWGQSEMRAVPRRLATGGHFWNSAADDPPR
jgi:hypothetical protein